MTMLRLFIALTFLTGVLYPVMVTLYAQVFFSAKANGSQVTYQGKVIGSELLAQAFVKPEFFHPRPSAGDYATVSSGASQHSPTHKAGQEKLQERRQALPLAGVDLWTTSGSGLDPHISLQSAMAQVPRIAAARNVPIEVIEKLVAHQIEAPTLGIWGRERINVLKLNIALMELANANAGADTPRS